jgi:hypothetical protein
MKNVVKLQHYYFPEEPKTALRDLLEYFAFSPTTTTSEITSRSVM